MGGVGLVPAVRKKVWVCELVLMWLDFSGFLDETTLVLCGTALIDLEIGASLASFDVLL